MDSALTLLILAAILVLAGNGLVRSTLAWIGWRLAGISWGMANLLVVFGAIGLMFTPFWFIGLTVVIVGLYAAPSVTVALENRAASAHDDMRDRSSR